MLQEFPSGPNATEAWFTPFGMLVICGSIMLCILLVHEIRRRRRTGSSGLGSFRVCRGWVFRR
jgi:hypothetical protein